jgi:hypothetical protein
MYIQNCNYEQDKFAKYFLKLISRSKDVYYYLFYWEIEKSHDSLTLKPSSDFETLMLTLEKKPKWFVKRGVTGVALK